MGRSRVALAVMVALLTTTVPSVGLAEDVLPAAAGTTLLRGDQTASVTIAVPEDAVLDLAPVGDPGVEGAVRPAALNVIAGEGRIGFVLTERGTAEGLVVFATQLPEPLVDEGTVRSGIGHGIPAKEDRAEPAFGGLLDERATCQRCRVPAGEYDLQLVTSTPGSELAITFEGLAGEVTLVPPNRAFAFGFLLGLEVTSDLPAHGAWIGMGMGWEPSLNGLMVGTYQLSVDPQTTPMAAARLDVCRQLADDADCERMRVGAGEGTRLAGSGILAGDDVDGIQTSLRYDTVGFSVASVELLLLWITTGTEGQAADTAEDGPECIVSASRGVEILSSICW
jgi:hypothetical protein